MMNEYNNILFICYINHLLSIRLSTLFATLLLPLYVHSLSLSFYDYQSSRLQPLNYVMKNGTLELTADFLATINFSINALVYGIFSKNYRNTLRSVFCNGCETQSIKDVENAKSKCIFVTPDTYVKTFISDIL